MAGLASINIKFLADLKGFSSQMKNVDRQLQQTGRKLQNIGAGLTVGVTAPLVAFGFASVQAFDKQAKALAQVEAGLKSTGNQVGFTSKQLQKMASDLQSLTLFGDEDILQGVTSQLLTFTNLTGEQFSRTQTAALDLATRLDGDLKSASIQLGKALNDPVANLSALSRSGIQFSVDQKKMINSLVETNQLAAAQTIILDELEKQYGGSAEAAAKAGLGPFTQLKNIIGDIGEEIGGIIVQFIAPFGEKLKEIASRFSELSPTTKKWIVILAGVAAAIGPLLGLVGTILPALITGFTILTGPIGLVIALLVGIGVVIAKNWAPIKRTLIEIANYFIDLYNESFIFRAAVEAITNAFKTLFEIGKFIFEFLKGLISSAAEQIKNVFVNLGAAIKAVLTGDFGALKDIFNKNLNESQGVFKGFTAEVASDWKNMTDTIGKNTDDAINNVLKGRKLEFISEDVDAQPVEDAVSDAVSTGVIKGLEAGLTGGGKGVKKLSFLEQLESDLEDLEFDKLNNMFDDVEQITLFNREALDAETEAFFGAALEASQQFIEDIDEDLVTPFEEKLQRMRELGEIVGSEVGNAFANMSASLINSLGLADSGFEGFIKTIAQTVTKLISIMLSQSISQAIAGATASGTATGPAAIFTTPAFIATAVSGVLAAFAAIPKFATGGIVNGSSFYGDKILARVNSGELILNQEQQKSVFEAMNQQPAFGVALDGAFRLSGEDLILAVDRTQKKLNRSS